MNDKYIQGFLPRLTDIAKWDEQRFIDYIDFCEFFLDGPKKDTYRVTQIKLNAMKKLIEDDYNPNWHEFAIRINKWEVQGYMQKLLAFSRIVFGFLKRNPAFITETILKRIEENPRFNWCLVNFKIDKTRTGIEIIAPQTLDNAGNAGGSKQIVSGREPERLFLDSAYKLMNIINTVASSIKPADIKKMKTTEKIKALRELSYVFTLTKGYKPNSQIFQQINVYSAGREDLEKAILDYAEPKD